MTIEEIQASIEKIRKLSDDEERAHGEEDNLYRSFIEYIARGRPREVRRKAQLIITTKDIDFIRWTS